MLSLTTGQLHDLLVDFTHDFPDCNIRSIRVCACDDTVSISFIDAMGTYHRVHYNVKTSVEFVKSEE